MALLGCAALLGCSEPAESPTPASTTKTPGAGADAIERTTERGPVSVTVSLKPAEPRLSDTVELELNVSADDGVEVTMPPFGDDFGSFTVRDFREELPSRREGRPWWSQRYQLDPQRAGTVEIPSIPVRFLDGRVNGDGEEHTIESESFEVEVTSLLAEQMPSLADLRPLEPALSMEEVVEPEKLSAWWWAAPAALGAVVAGLWWLRRRPRAIPPPPTPTELAAREFAALAQTDHLARGDFQSWYVEVTLIVRRFLERTHGIRAPEQTTDEFLRAMRSHPEIAAETKEALRAFLEAADLVKFAAHRPQTDDVERTEQRAREFVGLGRAVAEALA